MGRSFSRSTNPLDTKGLVAGDGGLVEVFGQRFRPTWTRLATSATAGESTLELMDQAKFRKKNAKLGEFATFCFFHIELLTIFFLQFCHSILSFGFGLLFLCLRTFVSFLFSGYVFNEARVSKKVLVARIVDWRAQKSKLQRCESNSFCESVNWRDTFFIFPHSSSFQSLPPKFTNTS